MTKLFPKLSKIKFSLTTYTFNWISGSWRVGKDAGDLWGGLQDSFPPLVVPVGLHGAESCSKNLVLEWDFVLRHLFLYLLVSVQDLAIFDCSFELSMQNCLRYQLKRSGGQESGENMLTSVA